MKYRCPQCGTILERTPRGRYVVSYCAKVGLDVRLVKVTKPKT